MNDIPTTQHIRDVGIDNNMHSPKKSQLTKILASAIIDDEHPQDEQKSTKTFTSKSAMLRKLFYKDQVTNQPFEGQNWIYDKGKWYPPDQQIEKPSVQVTKAPPSPIDISQSDSGANRIVTDKLHILTDIKYIPPISMSGCHKEEGGIVCTAIGFMVSSGMLSIDNIVLSNDDIFHNVAEKIYKKFFYLIFNQLLSFYSIYYLLYMLSASYLNCVSLSFKASKLAIF